MAITREEMWRQAEEACRHAEQIPSGSRAVIDAKYRDVEERAAERERKKRVIDL